MYPILTCWIIKCNPFYQQYLEVYVIECAASTYTRIYVYTVGESGVKANSFSSSSNIVQTN